MYTAFEAKVSLRYKYRGADKSLSRPGMKQARKQVMDARRFNSVETRAVIKSPPPARAQGKASKEIHAFLTETLACFLLGRAKDLSAHVYKKDIMYRCADKSLAATRKETGSEACQGRARFQQHRDASCHRVSFPERQGAEGNSRHSDRNFSLFPSWSG
jgi:hypothetical protein